MSSPNYGLSASRPTFEYSFSGTQAHSHEQMLFLRSN